jgi:hypothetical protein
VGAPPRPRVVGGAAGDVGGVASGEEEATGKSDSETAVGPDDRHMAARLVAA